MKPFLISSLVCLSTCLLHAEEEKDKRIPRKPPTHAELTKKRAEIAKNNKKKAGIVDGQKSIVLTKERSLIANSTLLAHGRYWTLVPRGSVIHIPPRYRDKIVSKPTGELLEWHKFLRRNQGWLQTLPITMKQAQGKDMVGEKSTKAYQSIGKVIVGTCANGPITMAKKPAEPAKTAKPKTAGSP